MKKKFQLLRDFPDVAEEFHPTLNGDLTPGDFSYGSRKSVWWKSCSKGHPPFSSPVYFRTKTKPSGCPYCAGKKIIRKESLEGLHPETAKQWHPTKNGSLLPSEVTPRSGKKIWWVCDKGHDYQQTPHDKIGKSLGCPVCSGKIIIYENSLKGLFPQLSEQWHGSKNQPLTPEKTSPFSNDIFWWICPLGHEFEASPNSRMRTYSNRSPAKGCPYCSNKKVNSENCLATTHPEIAKQWHPKKNKKITPYDIVAGSNKKVWWKCEFGHEYQSEVYPRVFNDRGCGVCTSVRSIPELRIFSELKTLFTSTLHRTKIDGFEVDVFVPELNLAIEYDGWYWHQDKEASDKRKNKHLKDSGITIIRLREEGLPRLNKSDISVKKNKEPDKKDLNTVLRLIRTKCDPDHYSKIDEYLGLQKFIGQKIFKDLVIFFPKPLPDQSIKMTHPYLSEEWDYSKNHPLSPEYFTFGSKRRVWWVCKRDKEHKWKSSINARTSQGGRGCPFCSGKKVLLKDSVFVKFANFLKYWDSDKNKKLPKELGIGSHYKVNWRCPQCGWSWKKSVRETFQKHNQLSTANFCPKCRKR